MADEIVIQPIWDDSKFKGSVFDSINAVKKMGAEVEELNDVTARTNKDMTKAIFGSNKALDTQMKVLKDTKKEGISYSKALEDAADNINIMGVNLGGTIRSLKAKQGALKAMVSGLGASTKGLKLFKVALASTGIGLLVVALGSLVAWFTKTQEGIDKVNRVLSGLSAAFSVVVDRAAKVGGALVGLLSGTKSLSEAWKEGKEAVSGLGTEIAKEAVQAAALTGQLQNLKRAEDELNIKRAESRAEIKRLNQIAEDTTKSTKERADAARTAIAIETDLAEERKNLLEQQLTAQKALDDQGNSTDEDLAEQRRLRTDIANQATESLELQTTLTNKLNTIENERRAKMAEEAARLTEIKEAYESLLDSVIDSNEEFVNATLSPAELLIKEATAAKSLISGMREQVVLLGKDSGKTAEQIQAGLSQLDKLEVNLDAQISFANARLDDSTVESLENDILKPLGGELVLSPSVVVKPEIDTSGGGLTKFKSDLLDSLGITEEEANQISESLTSIFQSVQDIYTASIQNRISALDEEIEKRQENREALEDELRRHEELQSEGYAQRAEQTREAIAEELEQENKAIEERDKLRQKEQKLQAISQLATQVTSLITAGAQIFEAEGSKGAVGVVFAIAAIASMIASFAKLKNDAKKQTRLYTGGSLSDHLPGATKSDKTGQGYQLHDGDTGKPTGVFIGGKEDIMREELGEHKALFKDMNANPSEYKGVDMVSMVRSRKRAIAQVVNISNESPNFGYVSYTDKNGKQRFIEFKNGAQIGDFEIANAGQIKVA